MKTRTHPPDVRPRLFVLVSLSVLPLHAGTLVDDFDDDSRSSAIWEVPFVDSGDGQLAEQNGRVEFSAAGSLGETDVSQQLKRFPSYDQAWQVQMVASMDKGNFAAEGEVGAISIDIGTTATGDKWLGAGYAAGVIVPAGASEQAVATGASDGSAPEYQNITPQVLPTAIGIRVAYDPGLRTIRVYYDADADQADGDWTLYETYTIDGSTLAGAVSLDWGMTGTDTFQIHIDGYSSGAAIAAGSAWADNFEYTPGPFLPAPTAADDFDDNSRDPAIWQAPFTEAGSGQMTESNQRLEFTATAAAENEAFQPLVAAPRYDESWQAQAVVSVDKDQFTVDGETCSLGMGVRVGTGYGLGFGFAAGQLPGETEKQVILAQGSDASNPDGAGPPLVLSSLPDAIGIRATYDPDLHLFRLYYDLDTDQDDGDWTPLAAYTIDGSTYPGAWSLDWGMVDTDTFQVGLDGFAENAGIPSGTAWVDDVEFNLGSTAIAEPPLIFIDRFDDDRLDGHWDSSGPSLGTPDLVEEGGRLEFRVESPSGEQEYQHTLGPDFRPRFDQAFELRMNAHCLPAAAMGSLGQVAVLELRVESDAGAEDLAFSLGAANLSGSKQQVYAVNNSATVPPGDPADVLVEGALPSIVGMKVSWDPVTRILACFVDTDDDPTVESWVPVTDYTLDGVDRGADHTTDWGMADTDTFRFALNGYADSTLIAPGEAFIDHFSLVSDPPPSGYEIWASAIPDEAKRGTEDDASGNGIPNLLQYMYGMDPLDSGRDVQMTIRMESGAAVLVHGFNPAASDYSFEYWATETLAAGWEADPGITSIEVFESGGKTFRRVSHEPVAGRAFFRATIVPNP